MNPIINQYLIDSIPGYFLWKDCDSNYIGCNQAFSRVAGFKNPASIQGQIDSNLPWQEYSQNIRDMDQLVLVGEECTYVETTKLTDQSEWIFYTRKKPLYNAQGKISGLSALCQIITHPKLIKKTHCINKQDIYHFGFVPKQYQIKTIFTGFTERETCCLFYLIRGNTFKEIARKLNISNRTVETHIENIKLKMNCTSRSSLIEKCIDLGFIHIIPTSIYQDLHSCLDE